MTPAELAVYAKAYGEREEQRRRIERAHLYAHAALMRRMIWAKRAPEYEEVFQEDRDKRAKKGAQKHREMTAEAMFETLKALTLAMGGTVEK